MSSIQLSTDDQARLAELLIGLSARARFSISLEGLLSRWSRLVDAVEEGFDDCLDEYTNDVSVRDSINEVIAGLSMAGGSEIARIVNPLDERFLAATVRVAPALRRGSPSVWWTRVPRTRSPELDEELRSLGFLIE